MWVCVRELVAFCVFHCVLALLFTTESEYVVICTLSCEQNLDRDSDNSLLAAEAAEAGEWVKVRQTLLVVSSPVFYFLCLTRSRVFFSRVDL